MNKTKTLCKISLVSIALVLLLVSSTALAATEKSASPKVTETQITTDGHAENPIIYGDKIVWKDNRNGNSNIYMYDLSTKKETQISTNESVAIDPAIYGDKIVWSDGRNSSYNPPTEIHMYDLSTSKESLISPSDYYYSYVYLESPKINGDKIVWDVWDGMDTLYICMYDLSTKEETFIDYDAYSPAIYGNTIVWNSRYGNICMYDLSTKKKTLITTSGSAASPAIYGNRIVWEDSRNGNADIYMYDVSTKKKTQITSSPDSQTHPAIYGSRIVWEDDGGEDDGGTNHGIYMYDISTNQKMKISTNGSAYYPAIYGDKIVWQYGLYENSDIYMATISSGESQSKLPVAAFSASPRSGKAPLKVQFTDKSSNNPTSWKWSFGDRTYSTAKNPVHKYSKAGKYTVSLIVKNAKGSNTKTTSGYIVAKK